MNYKYKDKSDSVYSACIIKVKGELERDLARSLAFIDWERHIKKKSVVFIKPNFTFPYYKEGVTTNPTLLKSLIKIIRSRTDNIIIGESNGGDNSFKAEEAFRGHGMYDICREVGARLVNLSNFPSTFVESEIQNKKVKVQLPKMLLENVDCFISVPVLKVHVITGVSLGLKNLWGCYPDSMRGLHHQNLDRKLTLLAKVLKPKIVVIDGLYGLNSHGPMFGDPIKMDLILVSNNIVVADTLGTMIMGFALKEAKHILVAENEGLGITNLKNVKVNTDWRQYKKHFMMKKTLLDNASSLLFYNDLLAKLVMSSPATPLIYKIAHLIRTPEEKGIANQLNSK
jgi:uncharacterized protein (DUF362 family)